MSRKRIFVVIFQRLLTELLTRSHLLTGYFFLNHMISATQQTECTKNHMEHMLPAITNGKSSMVPNHNWVRMD